MAKKSEMNSMRRKVIADSAPQRKAESQADDQINSLADIGTKLDEQQIASELIADTVESKGNQITSAINDVEAGVELTAEYAEKNNDALGKLNETSLAISDKLTKLANLLTTKTEDAQVINPSTGTSIETISEQIPEPAEQPALEDLLEQLIPPMDNNNPDADFFPPTPQPVEEEENKKDEEDLEKKREKFFDGKFGALTKGIKSGFGKSIALTDKIASMLFSYTVTALVQMAKTAAMVMGVIMLIDVLKIHFEYWTSLFESSFTKFNEQAKEWGPLLESISEMSKEIIKTFTKGDWGGLAAAIGKGLVDIVDKLAETMMLGMGKLLAGLLRAMGFDEAADNVEGASIDRFQSLTGAQLDEEDAKKRAKYVDKQEREYDERPEWQRKLSARWQKATGQVTEEEYQRLLSGEKKQGAYSDMSEDDRVKLIMARNDAEAELKRTKRYVEKTDADDSDRMKSAEEAVNSSRTRYKELEAISPEAANTLKDDLDRLEDLLKSKSSESVEKAQPIPAAEQTEAKQSVSIQNATQSRETLTKTSSDGNSTVNVTTAVNKNSTNVYQMPPRTSTPAPGMGGSMKTN